MNAFQINQIFTEIYPPEAAEWCNNNNATIVKVDGGYQIVAIPEPTLAEAQNSQLNTINAQYDAIVAMAKVNTPDGEVLTWDIQKTEAEAWQADNNAATPFIDGIAQGRGMDRVVLIEKVLVKTAAYRDFVAIKTGIRQRLEDAIFAAETVEAVSAIVWPVDDNEGTNNASAS